jgi:cell wall-associated NlpC family hydrolase
VGCDCLGLVRGVWRALTGVGQAGAALFARLGGGRWRETLAQAARAHLIEIDPAEFAPGDVLLFRYRALSASTLPSSPRRT